MKKAALIICCTLISACLAAHERVIIAREHSFQQPKLSEEQKIERLIGYVAAMNGAVFIRNGSEHTPAEAAEHLRMKRKKAGSAVKTAKDFIEKCASKRSVSGSPYLIRSADGRERTAAAVLNEQLARM